MHGLKCKCCNCTTCFKHQRVYRYRQMNQLFHGRWQKQVMKLKSHVKICLTRSSRFYQINIIKKILRAFWFFITGKSTHAINTINNGSFQKSQSVTESRPFLTVINQKCLYWALCLAVWHCLKHKRGVKLPLQVSWQLWVDFWNISINHNTSCLLAFSDCSLMFPT